MGIKPNGNILAMLHGIEITLEQYTGMCKGVIKTEPIDVIYATSNGEKRKLGFVSRFDNATTLLIRHLKPELREPVRLEVERLRMEQSGCSITRLVSCPPDPKLIKAYVKGDLNKSPKTTIVMPDGTPAGDDDDDE